MESRVRVSYNADKKQMLQHCYFAKKERAYANLYTGSRHRRVQRAAHRRHRAERKITLQESTASKTASTARTATSAGTSTPSRKRSVNGLKAAHDAGFAPATIGIDTWAVDFVLLDADNKRIGDAVAYRDERTEASARRWKRNTA